MSIVSPPQPGSRPQAEAARIGSEKAVSKTDQLIDDRISETCRALWWAELVRSVLRLVICGIVAIVIWLVVDQWVFSPGRGLRTVLAIGLTAAAVWYVWSYILPLLRSSIRPEYAARSLERDLPELRQSLTSYVTLRRDPQAGGLRSRVVRSIGAVTAGRLRGYDELPVEATGTFRWWLATALALALLVAYAVMSPKNSLQSAARLAAPLASIEPARRVAIRDVIPGDAEAIAGRTVDVSAQIEGLKDDEQAYCRWTLPSGQQEVELSSDPESRRFVGGIELPHSVSGTVSYVIAAGDAVAGPFHLQVQDVPVVALQSVHYAPPSYTGQSAHTTSSGAITALDGTTVTILATTNRPVAKSKIEFNPRPLGDRIQATAGATEMEIDADGTSMTVAFPLRSARGRAAAVELDSYRIKVWDSAEQSNPKPIIYPIRVIADLSPEVSITLPFQSPTNVPIDAQQTIEVHASDPDFGLAHIGLEIRSGIDLIDKPVLWSDPKGAKGNRVVEFGFRPSRLGLRIGDTVQVIAVAIDNRVIEDDPSIEPNITRTDPIELRITPGDPANPQQDPGDEDRSPPDQSTQGEQSSESQEGQGQEQSGSGGGGSGQQQTGESQTGQSGESGEGQTGQQPSSEDQTGEGTSGEGTSGESPSTDKQPRDGQTGEGQTGEGQTGEGQTGEEQTGEQTGQESTESPSSDATGQQATGQQATGQQEPGTSQDAASAQDGSSSTPQGSGAQQQPGDSSSQDQATDSGAQPQGGEGAGTEGTDAETGPQESPAHDGEAFERIRNYLENKGKQQPPSGETGESQSGESQTGESQTGESQTGESQTGESQTGESQTGESQTGESQTGESQTGESQTGESQTGESQTGESQTGESQTGESETGESETGESETGESQTGESQTGESQTGESQTGESQTGESQTGESQTGESQTGESQTGESQTGESQTGESQTGESQTGESQTGESQTAASQRSGGATAGSGAGSEGAGQEGETSVPPAPANVDYAKKATDMVLDYLDETRDAPDRDLLEELNWDEQDLQRFADRWQKVREMSRSGQTEPGTNSELQQALESLGLRPPTEATPGSTDSADSLRGIRDAGNRKPPPAAFRDAFDAFRRAMGRQ